MTTALVAIAGALLALAGVLYGLWQRDRAAELQRRLEEATKASLAAAIAGAEQARRLEAVIARAHQALEEELRVPLDPDRLRARLDELLAWRVAPGPAGAVPRGSAS